MAHGSVKLRSITPAFRGVQDALSQRARLAASAPPSGLGTATAISGAVGDIAAEQRKNEANESLLNLKNAFDQEAAKRKREFQGRFDFELKTDEDIQEAADAFDLPVELFESSRGLKFKNSADAEKHLKNVATTALNLEQAQLKQRDPEAVEAPTPGPLEGIAGDTQIPIAQPSAQLAKPIPEGGFAATPKGLKNNEQKIRNIQTEIDGLNIQSAGDIKTKRFRLVPVEGADGISRWVKFDTAGEIAFTPTGDEPLVGKGEKLFTEPGTEEKIRLSRSGKRDAVTGPVPIPKGELATKPSQLTELQEREIPKLTTRLEGNPTFKSVQTAKLQTGNLLRLLALDFKSLTGQIRSNIARTIGQEKGPLNEGDIKRSGGGQDVVSSFNRGFAQLATGKFDEDTYNEFRETVTLINNNAIILEDKLISDVVDDATTSGRFTKVDPAFLRKALEVPDATGLIDQRLKDFSGDEIKETIQFLREEKIPVNGNTIFKASTLLRKKRKLRK